MTIFSFAICVFCVIYYLQLVYVDLILGNSLIRICLKDAVVICETYFCCHLDLSFLYPDREIMSCTWWNWLVIMSSCQMKLLWSETWSSFLVPTFISLLIVKANFHIWPQALSILYRLIQKELHLFTWLFCIGLVLLCHKFAFKAIFCLVETQFILSSPGTCSLTLL